MNDDINNILGQIGKIKDGLSKLQDDLEKMIIKASDENDLVTAIVNGKGDIVDFKFSDFHLDNEMKSAMINAINNGLKKVKKLKAEKKQEILGDINLPDMPEIFD